MNQNVRNLRNAGYTIDQTILIVAVIAILVTLIIGSVGWDLLARSSGTKLASHFKQVEEANAAFYARYGVWPHDASTGTPAANVAVLKSSSYLQAGFSATNFTDFLPGYQLVGGTVTHELGAGGNITQQTAVFNSNTYLQVTMTGVPLSDAQEADDTIDGEESATDGRVRYTTSGSRANVSYFANLVN